jgi:hypothetical protein
MNRWETDGFLLCPIGSQWVDTGALPRPFGKNGSELAP